MTLSFESLLTEAVEKAKLPRIPKSRTTPSEDLGKPACLDCGTLGGASRGKRARGLCMKCYQHRKRFGTLKQFLLTIKETSDDLGISPCRDCETKGGANEGKRTRGLCVACYTRHHRQNTLDQFDRFHPNPPEDLGQPPCLVCGTTGGLEGGRRKRGLCKTCHNRHSYNRTLDQFPLTVIQRKPDMSLEEFAVWFADQLEPRLVAPELGECLEWTGAIAANGYGKVSFLGKGTSAHRVGFYLMHGRFPEEGFQVNHRCDNKKCCRGDHLYEGTARENALDVVKAKGRRPTPPCLGCGTVYGSNKGKRKRKLCESCYQYHKKHGSLELFPRTRRWREPGMDLEEFVLWFVDQREEQALFEEIGACWIWTGAYSSDGYGTVSFRGKNHQTHRVSFFLMNGRFPAEGKVVCHRCDNRNCYRPDHLYEGTLRDNALDAAAGGHLKRINGES